MKIFIKFWLLSSGLCALKAMKSYMGNLPVNTESSVFWTTACLVPGAYNFWSKSPLASWSLRSALTTSPSLVILLDLSEDKASCTLKTDIDANQRLGNRPCSANPWQGYVSAFSIPFLVWAFSQASAQSSTSWSIYRSSDDGLPGAGLGNGSSFLSQ